jgi:hypothetical protein
LVLIVAFVFFRSLLSRKRQRSSTAVSPYMNSLDGMMSAEQISEALDNYARLDRSRTRALSRAR